jgi:plastocyanin
MRGKVQRDGSLRLLGLAGIMLAVLPLAAARHRAVGLSDIRGRLTVLDRGDSLAEDVGQAVVWLEGGAPAAAQPVEVEISTASKEFTPHVLVIPVGSTVAFPNHDPFNHNVFSLSKENPFDLGLYGRGARPSTRFSRPGIVSVYCNIHAQMSALVIVRDNPYFTQPGSDGWFTIAKVPPGKYVLHAWHERAREVTQDLTVGADGVHDLAFQLDARGYRFKPHLNKFGQPYALQGRRY